MNERINELIEKATVIRNVYHPGDDGHPTPTPYFDKEKFAELIVRECTDIIKPENNGAGFHPAYIDGRDDAAFLIKEHFGVEE